jgi:hypothetical protein
LPALLSTICAGASPAPPESRPRRTAPTCRLSAGPKPADSSQDHSRG